MLEKVISGGQTGADRLGLEVARELGFPTGGTAPKGFLTENGPDLSLKEFGLVESPYKTYPPRTEQNVIDSDGTVLFGKTDSTGSKSTIKLCVKHSKPYKENPSPNELINFLKENNIKVLNVAGNRASKMTMGQMYDIVRVLKTTLNEIGNGK